MPNKESIVIHNQSSKIKPIIFDFDGVLADSFGAFYPLLRDGMAHIGLDLTQNQYRDFFIGNIHQSFKNAIGDERKYSALMEFRKNNYDKYYYDKKNGVVLFSGVRGFIKKLDKKYILTISSSGRRDNIKNLLEANKLKSSFSLILASTAETKEYMITKILNKFHAKPKDAVMISDTVGDIMMAKKVGLKTIAVTWGFHSTKNLKKSNPDFVAKNFKELFAKIDKLQQ